MRAAGSVVRDLALAVGAGTGRSRFFRRFAHAVDLFDHHKYSKGNQQEINHCIDELTVGNHGSPGFLRFGQGGIVLVRQVDKQVGKVYITNQLA